MSSSLRIAAMQEIKNNLRHYSSFINSGITQIDKYLKDGVFAGDIGDLLLNSLSNTLAVPFCIITARSDIEVMIVKCKTVPVTEHPIFVAFHHSGAGHYSAVQTNRTKVNWIQIRMMPRK